MRGFNIRHAVAVASAIAAFSTTPDTQASLVTSVLLGTGWMVNYDTAQVTSFAFVPNPAFPGTSNNAGTLSLTYSWTNTTPISITFFDTPPVDTNFGLRITINETVANNSALAIKQLDVVLVDTTGPAPSPPAGSTHPGLAHFHNDTTSLGIFTNTGLAPGTAPFSFSGTAATLASGASTLWTGIGLHEWEIGGVSRNFQLIETPAFVTPVAVDEPGALALLIFGVVACCGVRLSRTMPIA